jgi:hypothetical protein
MEQYLGTEAQIRLQQKADAFSDWLYETRGACHTGRFLGTDDPETLGWDTILQHLRRDRVFGFRMVAAKDIVSLRERLADYGFRIDFWDVYSAPADRIRSATEEAAVTALPEGLGLAGSDELQDVETIRRIQECMLRNGIAPFSGRMLSGQSGPSVTIAVRDQAGHFVATAYGNFPYNRHSPYRATAWGGLVAVDRSQRGKGLGALVNALMVRECVTGLGAEQVQEFVAETNAVSRRMVEGSGLRLDPSVKCGVATSEGERFTR